MRGGRCLLLAALATGNVPAQATTEIQAARLEWVECWFAPVWDRELRCAYFYPSRTATEPAVRLPVLRIKPRTLEQRPSPVLYLPGGPGSPVGLDERGLARWWQWQDAARWPHDIVLFDLRGTGLSQPRLDCPEVRARDRENLARPLSAAQELAAFQQSAAACYQRLRASGFRAEDYSTPRQVRDVGELLTALGGDDWNLWGISYGSRLALQVLRQYPERVRALVLDSSYPPEVNGLITRPAQFARALDDLVDYCAADESCGQQYPRLRSGLLDLFARLARSPVLIRVAHWPTERVTPLLLTDYRLLWMLFLENYRPRYQPRIIPALAAAQRNDYAPWQPIAASYLEEWLDPDFSQPVYLSITCAEDLPGVSETDYQSAVARHPRVATYLADEWRLSPCREWPVAALPQALRRPVSAAVPALFLAGRHDAATLPEWSRSAVARFSHGHHLVLDGSSHAVTWNDHCAMAVAWEFLQNPLDWPLPPCLDVRERSEAVRPAAPR